MRILFHSSADDPAAWLSALAAALPEASLRVWQEGDDAPADYALVWKPPAAMLQGRHALKGIFNLGAGVDAILQLGDALPAGVPLIRLDDAGMAIQMAEYVMHAVLRYYRRFDELEAQARAGKWNRSLHPFRKSDFPVGILGLGVLGTKIAQALAPFGFPLLGWSRSGKDIPGVSCHAGEPELDTFLRSTRVLVCVLPLTSETAGILNRANMAKLRNGAYVINIARGAHLVEEDLLALLHEGHIAGATLDVFQTEPLPAAHPFWQEPRVTITPHVAALTLLQESVEQIAVKIRAMQRGETVAGIVDRNKGY
ncbi:2-hydroxyacid dehydrogenase [Noviherbaspirillum autotrophicum]|uniref:Glyoxylate reductase n=1 Tax=Noviherbaspirillum autotrophicum TaxID=709839 RepID=A0A0C1XZE2_9BURK|nr:glyoxylate/hydroxypyruvate reductase A [Noviherbaspirillum autotrophicum]KIF80148.1 glyoxylate reductase [Noviherbaspirillum autotrophicum]